MSRCDQSNITDSDDLPLLLVFEEDVPLTGLLQSVGAQAGDENGLPWQVIRIRKWAIANSVANECVSAIGSKTLHENQIRVLLSPEQVSSTNHFASGEFFDTEPEMNMRLDLNPADFQLCDR